MGEKSKVGSRQAEDRVRHVSDQINMIMRHVPYVQANFVHGLDSDEGLQPFELTKKFIDMTPGVFPGYSLLTSFGRAAPQNLELQFNDRVIPFPFHFLDNNHAMNVRPLNYTWSEFYDHVIDLTRYTFSPKVTGRRFIANRAALPRWLNFVRGISSEGSGRLKTFRALRRRIDTDSSLSAFLSGKSTTVPEYYVNIIRKDLGAMWKWLPEGAIEHNPKAYLEASRNEKAKVAGSVAEVVPLIGLEGAGA